MVAPAPTLGWPLPGCDDHETLDAMRAWSARWTEPAAVSPAALSGGSRGPRGEGRRDHRERPDRPHGGRRGQRSTHRIGGRADRRGRLARRVPRRLTFPAARHALRSRPDLPVDGAPRMVVLRHPKGAGRSEPATRDRSVAGRPGLKRTLRIDPRFVARLRPSRWIDASHNWGGQWVWNARRSACRLTRFPTALVG